MKRVITGVIVLDPIDVICLSFSAGCVVAYLSRKCKRAKVEDPIITELKIKSPIVMSSETGKPLKLPRLRGGDKSKIKGFSLVFKNKRLAKILRTLLTANKKRKQLRLLRKFLALLNMLLTYSYGLRFAAGGSLDYTQILLIAVPSTTSGFLLGRVIDHPLLLALAPLVVLYNRGIQEMPDPYEKCRAICQAAEQYHNRQLMIEMTNFNSLIEDAATEIGLPIDKLPLVCVEQKLSLLERYKLKEMLKSSEKTRKRIQHFSEFIKKFPECESNSDAVYEEILNQKEKILN